MRNVLFALAASALLATTAAAQAIQLPPEETCTYPQRTSITNPDGLLTLFLDPVCLRKYETGYRLEGNTLYFPLGHTYSLPEASPEEAEEALRALYGLVGSDEQLVRTRFCRGPVLDHHGEIEPCIDELS